LTGVIGKFRGIISAFVTVVIVLGSLGPLRLNVLALDSNPIQNPGFEAGGTFPKTGDAYGRWFATESPYAAPAYFTSSSEPAGRHGSPRTGNYFAGVPGSGNDNIASIQQTVGGLTGGEYYKLTGYIRNEMGNTSSGNISDKFSIGLRYFDDEHAGNTVADDYKVVSSSADSFVGAILKFPFKWARAKHQ
jgi:hypothetical protein